MSDNDRNRKLKVMLESSIKKLAETNSISVVRETRDAILEVWNKQNKTG